MDAGHYVSYICPKANDEWFFFNDDTVTKCTTHEAVEGNYGNDTYTTSAYILVYIKDSCLAHILRPVDLNDLVSLDLIQNEEAKEKIEMSREGRNYEVLLFTPEKLQMNSALKHGKSLLDHERCIKFTVGKTKKFSDMLDMIRDAFCLNDATKNISLWMANMQKDTIRYCDFDENKDKELRTLFRRNRANFFAEILPNGECSKAFDKTKHALVFIKEYNGSQITFFGHHYFDLDQTVQDVQAYIREMIQFEGADEQIAIIEESGVDDRYVNQLIETNQSINEIITRNVDTFSATVTFEILSDNCKPKYLSLFSDVTRIESNTSQDTQKPNWILCKQMIPANGINVIIRHDTNCGEKHIMKHFDPQSELSEIVHMIGDMTVRNKFQTYFQQRKF